MEKLETPIVLHTQHYACPLCDVPEVLNMQVTALKQLPDWTVECRGHVKCQNCGMWAQADSTVSNEAILYAQHGVIRRLLGEAYSALARRSKKSKHGGLFIA